MTISYGGGARNRLGLILTQILDSIIEMKQRNSNLFGKKGGVYRHKIKVCIGMLHDA